VVVVLVAFTWATCVLLLETEDRVAVTVAEALLEAELLEEQASESTTLKGVEYWKTEGLSTLVIVRP